MKIIASQKTLLTALSRIQGVVEKSSIKPITANALIETTNSGIAVSATNLQIGMTAHYEDVSVKKEGKISVNARKAFEIIKEFPEDDICIEEMDNYWVEISCGKDLKFNIIGLPPEDFPQFINEKEDSFVSWETDKLLSMLNMTSFSISRDETKQNINGAFFENIEGGQTRIVTTDGYRLSIIDSSLGNQLDMEEGLIIPQKAIIEINKIIQEKREETSIKVLFNKNSLMISIGEIELFVRLIEKKFPDYRVIIPGDGYKKIRVSIEKNRIKPALKRMSIISNENNRPVIFSFSGKMLEIKTEDSELGKVEETLEVKDMVKDDFSFCINCMYLLDVLTVIDGDIVIEFNADEENKPIIVRPDEQVEEIKYIIMPMIMD